MCWRRAIRWRRVEEKGAKRGCRRRMLMGLKKEVGGRYGRTRDKLEAVQRKAAREERKDRISVIEVREW